MCFLTMGDYLCIGAEELAQSVKEYIVMGAVQAQNKKTTLCLTLNSK